MSAAARPCTSELADQYRAVRACTEALIEGLSAEDCSAQSMPDASPAKWHLGHTSWFFEVAVLAEQPGYRPFDPAFQQLFNSYYEAAGPRHPRPARGLLTRPSLAHVLDYRHHVDVAMAQALADQRASELIEIGLHHERQHQELLLMDVIHLFAQNPLAPALRPTPTRAPFASAQPLTWMEFEGGLVEIGAPATGFSYDCERPRHKFWLEPFELAQRPVSNGEWLEFMAAGGYEEPLLWLSDGYATCQREGWRAPGYWRQQDGNWYQFGAAGLLPVDPAAPVCHVSYYEAEAYARFRGARLPSESEWEYAAAGSDATVGHFLEAGIFRPGAPRGTGLEQLFGDVWEWTQSPFAPYPGFTPAAGLIEEYNGKFMAGQWVLKGGACITPAAQMRASYRNFFYPHQRWQYTGLRLARDI